MLFFQLPHHSIVTLPPGSSLVLPRPSLSNFSFDFRLIPEPGVLLALLDERDKSSVVHLEITDAFSLSLVSNASNGMRQNAQPSE